LDGEPMLTMPQFCTNGGGVCADDCLFDAPLNGAVTEHPQAPIASIVEARANFAGHCFVLVIIPPNSFSSCTRRVNDRMPERRFQMNQQNDSARSKNCSLGNRWGAIKAYEGLFVPTGFGKNPSQPIAKCPSTCGCG
jgi:hypothetical protein